MENNGYCENPKHKQTQRIIAKYFSENRPIFQDAAHQNWKGDGFFEKNFALSGKRPIGETT